MPRKPGQDWRHFKAEAVAAYVSRLGNLVLLRASSNTRLGNAAFSTKRPVYSASPYVLTRMVASATDWTPTEIDKRQEVLAGLAVKTWPK